jgi:hypothetical protein
MKTIYSAVPGALHAHAPLPGKHKAAMVVPSREGKAGDHHHSPEAITAVSIIGAVVVLGCTLMLFVCLALLKYTTGGKRHGKEE